MVESTSPLPNTFWKCSHCGNTVQVETPPKVCNVCGQACEFINITCYQPGCGFTGIDPRLK